MALIRSLTSGTSSLKAHQQRMDVISNNIANVNTTGFKASRTTFAEQFNQTFSNGSASGNTVSRGVGGVNPIQIGLGVKVGAITQDFGQGAIQNTGRPFDLALQGEGFFVTSQNGRQVFSRAGAFSLDRSGNLVDTVTGAFVQGYNVDTDPSTGKIIKDSNGINQLNLKVTNIGVSPSVKSDPRQTENVTVAGNLDAEMQNGKAHSPSITVYDNQGTPHTLRFTFTKTATANTFTLAADIDGTPLTVAGMPANVTFNNDGTLDTTTLTTGDFAITGTELNAALTLAAGTPVTTFDTAKNMTVKLADPNAKTSGLTQYSGSNTASATEQDGFTAGELDRFSVDPNGKVIGAFSNGQSEVLAQLVVAKFSNPAGLLKMGSNLYSVSPNSGYPNLGTAGEIFPSTTIAAGSLEESNVDLTEQFTELISTQRAFEAASRTVTLSDQLLGEINQLKR